MSDERSRKLKEAAKILKELRNDPMTPKSELAQMEKSYREAKAKYISPGRIKHLEAGIKAAQAKADTPPKIPFEIRNIKTNAQASKIAKQELSKAATSSAAKRAMRQKSADPYDIKKKINPKALREKYIEMEQRFKGGSDVKNPNPMRWDQKKNLVNRLKKLKLIGPAIAAGSMMMSDDVEADVYDLSDPTGVIAPSRLDPNADRPRYMEAREALRKQAANRFSEGDLPAEEMKKREIFNRAFQLNNRKIGQ